MAFLRIAVLTIFLGFLSLLSREALAQEFPPPESITPTVTRRLRFPPGATRQQKRDILQQRLQTITDQRRASLVLKINDKLTDINARATSQMIDVLNRVDTVLARLKSRLDVAVTEGRDTAAAQTAYTEALASLTLAQDAVASQAAKVYDLEASDSAGLRITVGRAIAQLQADLRRVRSLVNDAKHKVSLLVRELARTGVGKIGQQTGEESTGPALMRPVVQ